VGTEREWANSWQSVWLRESSFVVVVSLLLELYGVLATYYLCGIVASSPCPPCRTSVSTFAD